MLSKAQPPAAFRRPPRVITIVFKRGEPEPIGPWNDFPTDGCKWPHGDPNTGKGKRRWRMCGHPRLPGRSYCPYHDRRSRQSGLSVVP